MEMIKKKIKMTIFFVSQCALSWGAEKLEESTSFLDSNFECVIFPLGAAPTVSSLEQFENTLALDSLVDPLENLKRKTDQEEVDGIVFLSSESSLPHELEGVDNSSGHNMPEGQMLKDEERERREVEQGELSREAVIPSFNTIVINRAVAPKVPGRASNSTYKYCTVCCVWSLYFDPEGRHKKRKKHCDGYSNFE